MLDFSVFAMVVLVFVCVYALVDRVCTLKERKNLVAYLWQVTERELSLARVMGEEIDKPYLDACFKAMCKAAGVPWRG